MYFDPDAIDCMAQAYEAMLAKLNLEKIEDAATRSLAKNIIEVAGSGERDPVRISERAMGRLEPAIRRSASARAIWRLRQDRRGEAGRSAQAAHGRDAQHQP